MSRVRKRRYRNRVLLAAILFGASGLVGLEVLYSAKSHQPATGTGVVSASGVPAGTPTAPGSPLASASLPATGPNTFTYADAGTGVLGAGAGTVKKFKVAVENGTGQDAAGFATTVEQILGDPRGWTAGGDVRFQRVAQNATADFTVYLATPGTSEKLCAAGGIHTQQALSCRIPGQVIINLARWLTGVPGYGAPLEEYQRYEINHNVGRELGHANEGCPGPGKPAPVMQVQALGLQQCTANGWPFVSGTRYSGPVVP